MRHCLLCRVQRHDLPELSERPNEVKSGKTEAPVCVKGVSTSGHLSSLLCSFNDFCSCFNPGSHVLLQKVLLLRELALQESKSVGGLYVRQ